jgi:hypothetical protein
MRIVREVAENFDEVLTKILLQIANIRLVFLPDSPNWMAA